MAAPTMVHRTLLKRIASLLACALLFGQLAVAAHACPKGAAWPTEQASAMGATTEAQAAPDCHGPPSSGADMATLCAEHCKQGQQGDRANPQPAVPPALLTALYETAAAACVVLPVAGVWLSALVAASPPHALAHCVLRI